MRTRPLICVVVACLVALLLALPRSVVAQERTPSVVTRAFKSTLWDPTTYASGLFYYDATMRDWNTSQPFFQNGFVEHNERFTRSGRPDDSPITYAAGTDQILRDTWHLLAASAVHNFTSRVIEQSLRDRYPTHRKLVTALGWVERIGVASAMSYTVSAPHYRQWRRNQEMMTHLGIK